LNLWLVNATAITTVADEEDGLEETTVAAAVEDTGTIVGETEVVDIEGEIGVVPFWIAEPIVIITTVGEEATVTTTTAGVVGETIFAEDAIDRLIGEDHPVAAETIDVTAVLEVDHHHVVEITAETIEEVAEVTLEVLLEDAMMIVIGVVTRITEVVAVTTTISVAAL